ADVSWNCVQISLRGSTKIIEATIENPYDLTAIGQEYRRPTCAALHHYVDRKCVRCFTRKREYCTNNALLQCRSDLMQPTRGGECISAHWKASGSYLHTFFQYGRIIN